MGSTVAVVVHFTSNTVSCSNICIINVYKDSNVLLKDKG